jgi:hypothetical protein
VAITYKILGQSAPAATTETALYTVPSSTSAIISTISVCNRSVATSFRISIDQAGGGTANKDYLYYDVAIPANDTFVATVGITLAATDIVNCYATLATLSFSIFGSEIT